MGWGEGNHPYFVKIQMITENLEEPYVPLRAKRPKLILLVPEYINVFGPFRYFFVMYFLAIFGEAGKRKSEYRVLKGLINRELAFASQNPRSLLHIKRSKCNWQLFQIFANRWHYRRPS